MNCCDNTLHHSSSISTVGEIELSGKSMPLPKRSLGGEHGQVVLANVHGEPVNPGSVIIPIFRHVDSDSAKLVGTGFFVTRNGIFATAKHVLTDVLNAKDQPEAGLFVIQFLPDNGYIIRNVTTMVIHPVADVGLCVLRPAQHNLTGALLTNEAVTLSASIVETGSRVFTYAYPDTSVIETSSSVSIHTWPDCYPGIVEEYYPDGRDRVFLPSKCYQTSMMVHGGASGGPVFSADGRVVGINSTGFDLEQLSFVSCVEDLLDLAVPEVILPNGSGPHPVTLRQLAELGFVNLG